MDELDDDVCVCPRLSVNGVPQTTRTLRSSHFFGVGGCACAQLLLSDVSDLLHTNVIHIMYARSMFS